MAERATNSRYHGVKDCVSRHLRKPLHLLYDTHPYKFVEEIKMAYRPMYETAVKHDGLHKYRIIRGSDPYVVEQKAKAQQATWDEMWQKKLAAERKRQEKELEKADRERKKQNALERTEQAQKAIQDIENTLHHTLSIDDTIDWESLKDFSKFSESKPEKPVLTQIPSEPPVPKEENYKPTLGLICKIIPKFREKKEQPYKEAYQKVLEQYEEDCVKWGERKGAIVHRNQQTEKEYQNAVEEWGCMEKEFYENQTMLNASIEKKKEEYSNESSSAIIEYCDMVLANSHYPDTFPQEFDIDFNSQNGILVVECQLPAPKHLPTVKETKYIQSKDEFKEVYISESAQRKLYDRLLYQIALRTIHELYEADVIAALKSIVFNGWVRSVDKRIGKETDSCILSVQANREEFLSINLKLVDPKECFKQLKGVGSSKLHSLSPVAPIINIDKSDKRFVPSHDVAEFLDEGQNLAAMDWEEFEHLVRELFEKEFSQTGGEVKVTQSSRDGGVDAIAFDPDPIRGGKIVIQAKRYTNTVGVSAVRDLYGTVEHEGAIKGILVTTSDYGPDAYKFAKGKPITLFNGGNLLHLLEKHGHKAKIDLKEAKKILSEDL